MKMLGHRRIPYFHFTKLVISFISIYFLQNKNGQIIQREMIIYMLCTFDIYFLCKGFSIASEN